MGIAAIGRPAVFLDRDGVINRTEVVDGVPRPPESAAAVEVLPGVDDALRALERAGFLIVVVSNQPDVARGRLSLNELAAIQEVLHRRLPIHASYVCAHDTLDGCYCRKPRPGLLFRAAAELAIDLGRSHLVGDRWSDVVAGAAAGCLTYLVAAPYNLASRCDPDRTVRNLADAAGQILGHSLAPKTMTELHVRHGVPSVASLRVKIFADGADKAGMLEMARRPYIRGFTTNPTLMRRAGVGDYAAFARDILACLPDRPISFEVLSDEFEEMERQAREIASWGSNVFVKIPVMNTRREPSYELIARLAALGIPLNVTALLSLEQVERVSAALADGAPSFVSVFAGRIADTGRDPMPLMAAAVRTLSRHPNQELLWASPREVLNLFHADAVGCHVITMTNDLLRKLPLLGRDLEQLSLETVEMFHGDARAAGYEI